MSLNEIANKSAIRRLLCQPTADIVFPGRAENSTLGQYGVTENEFQAALREALKEVRFFTDARPIAVVSFEDLELRVGRVRENYALLKTDGIPRSKVPESAIQVIYSAQRKILGYAERRAAI